MQGSPREESPYCSESSPYCIIGFASSRGLKPLPILGSPYCSKNSPYCSERYSLRNWLGEEPVSSVKILEKYFRLEKPVSKAIAVILSSGRLASMALAL